MNQNKLRDVCLITIAMFVISISIYFFLIPSGIIVGSISGLAMVLNQIIPLSISVITLILNVGLLIQQVYNSKIYTAVLFSENLNL